jgi:hypothetical protein
MELALYIIAIAALEPMSVIIRETISRYEDGTCS